MISFVVSCYVLLVINVSKQRFRCCLLPLGIFSASTYEWFNQMLREVPVKCQVGSGRIIVVFFIKWANDFNKLVGLNWLSPTNQIGNLFNNLN